MSHLDDNVLKRRSIHDQRRIQNISNETTDSSSSSFYRNESNSFHRNDSSSFHRNDSSSYYRNESSSFHRDDSSRSKTPVASFARTKKTKSTTPETSSNRSILLVLLIFVLIGVGAYKYKFADAKCDLSNLKKQYSQYQELNTAVKLLVDRYLKNNAQELGVFLLLHKQHQPAQSYVHELAKQAAICLNSMPVVNITMQDFMLCPMDYGCTVRRYMELSETSTVMVIEHINKIPAQAAQALHEICDTYHPMATPALTFLTLTLPDDYVIRDNVRSTAYRLLEELWSTMPPNLLAAVIARVTDQVFWLGTDEQ